MVSEYPLFGPSGNSNSFYEQGHKKSSEAPEWLAGLGLGWYEYSCTRGANVKKETAEEIGNNAIANGIGISIHAPYYINLASSDEERLEGSRNHIYKTLEVCKNMSGRRIVFHPGSYNKESSGQALESAIGQMNLIIDEMKNMGCWQNITLCPETMGRKSQLGTLEEIMELCSIDERIIPTLDFGHLNARSGGAIRSEDDYKLILDYAENRLGSYRLKNLHIHFSHIEFNDLGEKKHLTFEDGKYGPFFEPLAMQLVKRHLTPVIVCESRDVMAEDALRMKSIYYKLIS